MPPVWHTTSGKYPPFVLVHAPLCFAGHQRAEISSALAAAALASYSLPWFSSRAHYPCDTGRWIACIHNHPSNPGRARRNAHLARNDHRLSCESPPPNPSRTRVEREHYDRSHSGAGDCDIHERPKRYTSVSPLDAPCTSGPLMIPSSDGRRLNVPGR